MPIIALKNFSRSTQVTHPHTRNGFQIYSCIIPGPTDQTGLSVSPALRFCTHETKTTIPLNATLNRLLVLCTFLGSPVEEEALKVQNKSYDISCFCPSSCSLLFTSDRIEPILNQLSKGIRSAINGTPFNRIHPARTRPLDQVGNSSCVLDRDCI
jgi:hypothetical protein